MRNARRRHNVRRVFVLGAGASYSATLAKGSPTPLDASFGAAIHELRAVQRPKWISEAAAAVEQAWVDHRPFESFKGLESAIATQMGHRQFLQSAHPKRLRQARTEEEWLTQVVHLMCRILSSRRSTNETYRKFALRVFPSHQTISDFRDRVITFNYDTLLDDVVTSRIGARYVYFDKIEDGTTKTVNFESPLILKLHGSANWRCRDEDFKQLLNGNSVEEPHYIEHVTISKQVPDPASDEFPLMVPPLPSKPITNLQLFKFLWTRAYEYLHQAEELVICGYSLPPADRLAVSMFEQFTNNNLKSITVVDPAPEMIARWRELLSRRGVSKDARWYYFPDFAEFVEQLQ